jgi:F0F1-type ATP synthase delta subunit
VELKLPPGVVSRGDLARLIRELNQFSDYLVGAKYRREEAAAEAKHVSALLAQLASINQLNLLDDSHLKTLQTRLDELNKSAPNLHVSFSAEPSVKAVERVLLWLRANVHPQTLLQVGLQPNIAAGCMLRTSNKVFDMSLRQTLKQQEPYLLKLLQAANRE